MATYCSRCGSLMAAGDRCYGCVYHAVEYADRYTELEPRSKRMGTPLAHGRIRLDPYRPPDVRIQVRCTDCGNWFIVPTRTDPYHDVEYVQVTTDRCDECRLDDDDDEC